MSFFTKLFKKKQKQHGSSGNNITVTLKTKQHLSEEQKNAIITIIKDGCDCGIGLDDIAIKIMLSTEIYHPISISRNKNSVEVIF